MSLVSARFDRWQLEIRQTTSGVDDVLNYPVRFTELQKSSIALDVGILKKGQDLSPIELAGFKVHEIASPTLLKIHARFEVALHKYKQMLVSAVCRDKETLHYYKSNFRIKEDYWIFWRCWAWFGCAFVDRDTVNQGAQYARNAWAVQVSGFEKERLSKTKGKIERAFQANLQALENMSDNPEGQQKIAKAARQLKKVYEALFHENLALPQNSNIQQLLQIQD